MTSHMTDKGPWFIANYRGECSTCFREFEPGDEIRADGEGGYECLDPCGEAEAAEEVPGDSPTEAVLGGHRIDPLVAVNALLGAGKELELASGLDAVNAVLDDDSSHAYTNASGQPREKTGRSGYLVTDPDTGDYRRFKNGNVKGFTRCTTFVKSATDTTGLTDWKMSNVLRGAAMRPDIAAKAHGKVWGKEDKGLLLDTVAELEDIAGAKNSADEGTLVHELTERIDAGDYGYDQVPDYYRELIIKYSAVLRHYGLEPVPGLIERTILTKRWSGGISGTFDRVYYHRASGTFVMGDVKGLALTERIPTPDGWTTMGAIQVGDQVFDAYGQPCTVTLKSDVKRIGTYIVRFDDGSSVVCDKEHIWWTYTGTASVAPKPRSIEQVIATLCRKNGDKDHKVPVAGALNLPEADLPIDPYLLGCWLGDGAVRGGTITKGRDLFKILEADGHKLGVEQKCHSDKVSTRTVLGLTKRLRAVDLLHNKHIPGMYLRASQGQRLRLLQGLMDTDGTWNTARRTAEFTSTDKASALQVEELLLSLGQRPNVAEVETHGFGLTVTSYRVTFTPVGINPFRLPRKADQAAASTKPVTRSTRRVIVSVEEGPDVETACIGVDSPTRTYLCGDRMIPTHNTGRNVDEYGKMEIPAQMKVYEDGFNTYGVFDWNTDTWVRPCLCWLSGGPQEHDPDECKGLIKVRGDWGVIIHMPLQGDDAFSVKLKWADLEEGRIVADLCHDIRVRRSSAPKFQMLDPDGVDRLLASPAALALAEEMEESEGAAVEPTWAAELRDQWAERFKAVVSREEATALWREAKAAGVTGDRLQELVELAKAALAVRTS